MTASTEAASAAFHDRIAPDYDALMRQDPGNAWVRAAFHELVKETVPAGSTILDFGCGTGDDAYCYASRGMKVLAYDNSPAMVAAVREKCARQIACGEVSPYEGPYEEFLAHCHKLPRGAAVTANFAVLNMIEELAPLFEALGQWVEPGGVLIASVLNPLYWREMRHPTRWRWIRETARHGVAVRRGELSAFCHTRRAFEYACHSALRLEERRGVAALVRMEAGAYDWSSPRGLAQRLEKRLWRSGRLAPLSKFWFLVFRRVP